VPSAVSVFAWIATIWRGRPVFETPFLFLLGFIVTFVIGGVSVGYAPASVTLFLGNAIHVDVWRIVEELIIAVVAPMAVAIAIRTRYEQAVARYDDSYSTVASLMVVLIIGGVSAANASLLHGSLDRLVLIGSAAFALNVVGYGLGWGAARLAGGTQSERLAGVFTVGMRDFAVAAALVVAAGFLPIRPSPTSRPRSNGRNAFL